MGIKMDRRTYEEWCMLCPANFEARLVEGDEWDPINDLLEVSCIAVKSTCEPRKSKSL